MAKYDCYIKIFIPEFVYVPKTQVKDYQFIETLRVGNGFGHILHGNGMYLLCLRKDDNISTNVEWGGPLGYARASLEECHELAKFYHHAFMNPPGVTNITALQQSLNQAKATKTGPSYQYASLRASSAKGTRFIDKTTNHTVIYTNLRETSKKLGMTGRKLCMTMRSGKNEVANYFIIRKKG